MNRLRTLASALAMSMVAGCAGTAQAPAPLSVYAAGSLRAAMTDLARAFEQQGGAPVRLTFGASGLLKDRIEAGEPAQVFASANMTHPEALRTAGKADAFDCIDCRQKRSTFTQCCNNGTGYRRTVVGHCRRLNCSQ